MLNMRPKVTVYITCHNYARFVKDAVESIKAQLLDDWELLIIDDGSQDNSREVIEELANLLGERVKTFFNESPQGLPFCANLAIDEAKGEYLIRLDADDYLDEAALLTMAAYLDKHQDIALVFPNYVYVDEDGTYLGVEQRKRIGEEAKVLDLPAHGACTMVRKRVLKAVGGYSREYNAQDGHEIWLNICNRYRVGNITTPLFFYRQHGASLTQNQQRVLSARQNIKRGAAKKFEGEVSVRVVGVIPAKNTYKDMPNVCLEPIAGKPLIDYTIEEALSSGSLDHVFVTSDDSKVIEHCQKNYPEVLTNLRSLELSHRYTKHIEVMNDAIEHLEAEMEIYPDIITVLNVHTPLRFANDIDEAVDTLLLYNVDSITSVYEDYDLHFLHGENGLEPLNRGALNQLRLEREALYVDNGAIKALWRDVLSGPNLFGQKFGHIVMPQERSILYSDSFTKRIIESCLSDMNAGV